jgi:hypothetical protein
MTKYKSLVMDLKPFTTSELILMRKLLFDFLLRKHSNKASLVLKLRQKYFAKVVVREDNATMAAG